MPDNLARVIEESNTDAYANQTKPEFKLHVNPRYEKREKRRLTIYALRDVTLSLKVVKLVSSTIKESKLHDIFLKAKEKIEDLKVKMELDKMFDECLEAGKKPVVNTDDKDSLDVSSAADEVKETNDKIISLEEYRNMKQESGQEQGYAKTMRDNNHHSNITAEPADFISPMW